ncbi:UBN2_3 domain-containing protein [Cucumis melo var. makuwa]|uniref:UBN2_3 domain-containing protein n=1 Tax=Cucumis melo var. makuwa TaxID=1194695 RepID=A0A5A7U2Z6_CUCMM|nr:UBN2_3 domain-containing protein [Cucumis melo var. makuwa]TYK15972.1 UBN2_3 domain-containing protein [Cucumis melo var. makuwa]
MANAASFSVTAALTTNFTNPPLNQILNQLTTVKLDRGNYLLWETLALPILKGYKLDGHLSDECPCPPKLIPLTTQPSGSTVENTGEPS